MLHEAFAIAAPGLAPLVAAECTALGMTPVGVDAAGVSLRVTTRELFVLNCWSRLASRILVRLASFEARDFATLEKQAARVLWSQVITPALPVQLRVTCRKSRLYHSDAVAERVARGIAAMVPGARIGAGAPDDEQAQDVLGAATAAGSETTAGAALQTQLIVVRFERDRCTISADSSGALLHRRGWRQAVAKAPLRETLAAAMLAAMRWDAEVPLVDPFCGSGTIGIEAALLARRIAPGLARTFAMEYWPAADAALHASVRTAAQEQVRASLPVPIVLRDRDAGAIVAAQANAARAGVLEDLCIEQGSLSETDLTRYGTRGLILTNPPYGHRISDGADLRGLYTRLGDVLRNGGRAWRLVMLTPSDRTLLGQIRMPMTSLLHTSNGGLAVELMATRA